jgi:tetratricopeptide (TPR) repeat protein
MKLVTLTAAVVSVGLATIAPALSQPTISQLPSGSAKEPLPNQIQRNRINATTIAIREGNKLFDAGKYGEAIKSYNVAVEQSGSNAQQIQARLMRSRAYVLATVFGSPGYDNYDQSIGAAIADCSRVISLEPNNSTGYACRGFAYSYIFSDNAFTDFNRAIELDPNNPNLYFERGEVYARSDKNDQAIADFSQAIKLNPQFTEAYYFRGLQYTYQKPADFQSAIADFDQAIKLNPNKAGYYDARGRARSNLKDYQGAIDDYRELLRLAPTANVYSDLGFAFAALGKNDQAIANYDEAILLVPKHSTAYYGRGLVRAKQGDKKAAMADFKQAQLNYEENMGKENFDQPEYQRILKAIEQL